MSDKTWKAIERRMSKDMGTTRIPVTGERAGADAETSLFKFQFKCRRMIPAWLNAWMYGICGSAKVSGKIGVLVLKLPGQRDADALAIVRWSDWCDLHGTERKAESECQG